MPTLDDVLALIPGGDVVSQAMRESALAKSLIPDSSGHLPGEQGYTPTHDAFYAALTLLGVVRAQPAVTTASSESTSISTTTPDWPSLEAWLRSQSVICRSQDTLTTIPITYADYTTKVYMEGESYRGYDADYS